MSADDEWKIKKSLFEFEAKDIDGNPVQIIIQFFYM